MPITAGALSARLWRVSDALPPHFNELFSRNLKRHAFRPPATDRGETRSRGWVNIRNALDTDLTFEKTHFREIIALALRVDRVTINPRVFRAKLAEETEKTLRARKREVLNEEERAALNDKVRMELLRAQTPSMSIYEMIWHLESGVVVFGGTSNRLNVEFGELFSETFNVTLEPQLPFLRAQPWAEKHKLAAELRELLPASFV